MDRCKHRLQKRTAVTKEQALNFLCANEAAEQNREAHQCGERNSNGITQPRGAATPMNCVNPPLAGSRSLAAVILLPRFFCDMERRKTSRKILLDFVNSFPTAAVPLCLRSALHKK
mgnify:CR=1 FL=1